MPFIKSVAPPSGKFSTMTPNFLHAIYRARQMIQSCKGRILKLHTFLEMLAKNPKLKTHFLGFRSMLHSQIFDTS